MEKKMDKWQKNCSIHTANTSKELMSAAIRHCS